MIPIKLTIEGLYSYQNRQTINFTDLIEAGLFGIFGAVGSGKSSILEAITFALYGETERLNARDKRTYNMMNLKSNRSYIEFDFEVGSNIYRATREFKRNSKRFDDVKTPTVIFYEWKNESWLPLEHSNSELLLGLSYENFKRTIIIPQGQFKEFIELGAKDRTQMMKEIFSLQRFDLQDKVAQLNSENLTELNQLEGKLSGFEQVSEDLINELKSTLTIQETEANNAKTAFENVNNEFQQIKLLKNDYETLQTKKFDFEALTNQKNAIDEERHNLTIYERYFNAFSQVLKEEKKLSEQALDKEQTVNSLEIQLKNLEKTKVALNKELEHITPKIEILTEQKSKLSDLDLVVKTLVYVEEITLLKQRSAKGTLLVDEVTLKEQNLKKEIKDIEEDVKRLEATKIDQQLIMDVENWFVKNEFHQQALIQQQAKVQEIESQITSIEQNLTENNIVEGTFETDITRKEAQFKELKNNLTNEKNSLAVQKQIAQYTHSLHDGLACPLCGSLEHPDIAITEDVTAKLNAIEKELIDLDVANQLFITTVMQVKQQLQRKDLFIVQQNKEISVLNDLERNILNHQTLFVWNTFSKDAYDAFKLEKVKQNEISHNIKNQFTALSNLRNNLEIEQQNVEKYKSALENFKREELQKQTQIQQNIALLKVLHWNDFEFKTKEEVLAVLKELEIDIEQTEQTFQNLNTQLSEVTQQHAVQNNSLQLQINALKEISLELDTVQKNIKASLLKNEIASINDVYLVLNSPIDVMEVRAKIEHFLVHYEGLKQVIQNLESKLQNTTFNEDVYTNLFNAFNEATTILNASLAEVTKTQTEINRLTNAFNDKKELLKIHDSLQKRKEHLKIMMNLFKASGFVQYVSTIYLQQLCDNANVRFHKMTRNQLSLQMNDTNDFEIVDYLNEGRSRSVKTLSGGQAFQVSLSLALALAESVQANAKSDRNFFFIDEGFGTQDQESVNIVFETLNHLHKENRIVGIISHVEELKERIPVSLNIIKTEEDGSSVTYNA